MLLERVMSEEFSPPKPKQIVMNEQLKKKSSRKLFIVGLASTSVFLSGAAFAREKTNISDSNQFFNNPTSLADSAVRGKEVLAQAQPEENKPPAPGDVAPRENPPPSGDVSPRENTSPPSENPTGNPPSGGAVSPPPPSDAKPRGSAPPPTGASPVDSPRRDASGPPPKPGTWLCINNPNPACRG